MGRGHVSRLHSCCCRGVISHGGLVALVVAGGGGGDGDGADGGDDREPVVVAQPAETADSVMSAAKPKTLAAAHAAVRTMDTNPAWWLSTLSTGLIVDRPADWRRLTASGFRPRCCRG